jgi:monothiol glutaredoxin
VLKHVGGFPRGHHLRGPELRDELKRFSNWPTYPQLYVKGELIGGCDIAMQMLQNGELKQLIDDATSKSAA